MTPIDEPAFLDLKERYQALVTSCPDVQRRIRIADTFETSVWLNCRWLRAVKWYDRSGNSADSTASTTLGRWCDRIRDERRSKPVVAEAWDGRTKSFFDACARTELRSIRRRDNRLVFKGDLSMLPEKPELRDDCPGIDQVRAAINKLPLSLQKVARLKDQGFGYEEIAADLKISNADARQRWYRAKKIIKTLILDGN